MLSWESANFVEHYLEHNSRYESPTSFWLWSAYGAISAVLRDNVYRRMGDNKLFPNMYILNLAESSFHRKGRPVEFAEDLVREVRNTKVISGRASIQAIVQELSRTETDSKTGKLIPAGSAIFFAPEMAAGLVADPAAISILTDIYETKKVYDSLLKTQAKSTIKSLVFSMLAASNEDLLRSVYDTTALRGGLLARTYLVVPDEFRKPNSLMDLTEEDFTHIKNSKAILLGKLKKISDLRGEVAISKGAQEAYDEWYKPFRIGHKEIRDKTGMLGRIHTSVLKLAIVLAANETQLVIERRHIEKAIDDCMALVPNYARLAMNGNGQGTIKDAGALVLNDLLDAPENKLSRRQIFQKHLLEFNADVFDQLIVNLETAGLVIQSFDSSAHPSYKLTNKALEVLRSC